MYPLQKFLEFDRFCSKADVGLYMNKKIVLISYFLSLLLGGEAW